MSVVYLITYHVQMEETQKDNGCKRNFLVRFAYLDEPKLKPGVIGSPEAHQ